MAEAFSQVERSREDSRVVMTSSAVWLRMAVRVAEEPFVIRVSGP